MKARLRAILEDMTRIVTWNVARRSSRLAEQAAALAGREPDLVALQEVTARTLPLWRAALATIGLPHVLASLDTADPRRAPASRRVTGVLIASRRPLRRVDTTLTVPWPETALVRAAETDAGDVELHVRPRPQRGERRGEGAHFRGDPPRAEGRSAGRPRRVPRAQHPASRAAGRHRAVVRPRHARAAATRAGPGGDAAELGVVPGLRDLGYHDAFRSLHGYAAREPSSTWQRISGHGGGWRLDHLFTSPQLRATACRYHHEWRDAGLSDHSALEADVVAG